MIIDKLLDLDLEEDASKYLIPKEEKEELKKQRRLNRQQLIEQRREQKELLRQQRLDAYRQQKEAKRLLREEAYQARVAARLATLALKKDAKEKAEQERELRKQKYLIRKAALNRLKQIRAEQREQRRLKPKKIRPVKTVAVRDIPDVIQDKLSMKMGYKELEKNTREVTIKTSKGDALEVITYTGANSLYKFAVDNPELVESVAKKQIDCVLKAQELLHNMLTKNSTEVLMKVGNAILPIEQALTSKDLTNIVNTLGNLLDQLNQMHIVETRAAKIEVEKVALAKKAVDSKTSDQHLHIHANDTGKAIDALSNLRTTQTDWQRKLLEDS